jgi:two-component system LytT family sensor kinase
MHLAKVFFSVLVLATLSSVAQINPKNKLSVHYIFSGVHMTLSNNFIKTPYKYTPTDLSLPFREERFLVYGSELTMSAFKYDSMAQLPSHHGSFFFDTLPKDKAVFEFSQLQVRVFKNSKILQDWKLVTSLRSFTDSGTTAEPRFPTPAATRNQLRRQAGKIKYMHAYSIISDSLNIGDSALIQFRHASDPPFLQIHLNRADAYVKPYMTSSMEDTSRTEQEFVERRLLDLEDWMKSSAFYYDWPHEGLSINNRQYLANTRLAFFFRSDKSRDDSTLLFRLLRKQHSDTSWRKTNGIIVVPTLQENTRYRLEVKFANGRGKTSVYTFYTPSKWYQTPAFKIGSAIAALAIVLGLILILRSQKRKRTRRLHDLEVQSLYAQMNPHFLFNALGSIQGLMNDNRIEQANLYLTEFAALLRASITQGKKELVPIASDIKNIDRYIELERLRFNFQYERNIDSKLALSDIEVPSMLAQPLIENAVKHAVSVSGESGMLGYSIQHENTDIVITVSDNGKGFNSSEDFSGQGLRLTRERIRLFNSMHRGRLIRLDFQSSPGGTKAIIRLQKWLA